MKEHFGVSFEDDPHAVRKNADFSALEALYAGKKAYYGDYHCHSNSGGSSDGKTTLENWLHGMKELKLDFVGIMDHRQVRHMYLDAFDPEYFLYGSEPLADCTVSAPHLISHYIMIFPKRDSLEKVLSAFPDVFRFTGDREAGPSFEYLPMTRERFEEVLAAVKDEGGAVVHAHPKQVMQSENLADYYYGEGSVIETGYCYIYPYINNPETLANYRLFTDMLNAGYKIYNAATNDSHTMPMSFALNTVYSDKKWGPSYVECLKRGDVTAGYIGIKMEAGGKAVGSTVKYRDGMTLCISAGDCHPCRFDASDSYRLEVVTDKGIAYSERITFPFKLALEVKKDRKFYRAVIIRESDGAPAAIGNPIWIEN